MKDTENAARIAARIEDAVAKAADEQKLKISSINSKLAVMAERCSRLQETVYKLQERLDDILAQPLPSGEDLDKEPEPTCNLVDKLTRIDAINEQTIRALADILDRLEL